MRFRYMLLVWLAPVVIMATSPERATAAKRPTSSLNKLKPKRKVKSSRKSRARRTTRKRRRRSRRDLWPAMKLEHVNTREKLTVRLYDRRGRTIKKNVQRIYRLMRCHQTGRRRLMHWRLIRALYKISRKYKGKTVRIYSGYRARKVAQLSESYHIRGRAMDIAVRGVSKRALRDYLRRTFKRSGVGYYPNSPFVHFDVRSKRAFWVDISGSGQRAKYVQAWDYLKRERKRSKRSLKPTVATKRPVAPKAAKLVSVQLVTKATTPAPTDKTVEVAPASTQPQTKPRVVRGPAPVGPTPPAAENKPSAPQRPAAPAQDDTSDSASSVAPERKLSKLPATSESKPEPRPEPKPERAPVSKIRSAP